MANIHNPDILHFTPINTATFNVAGGAPGWIDTDVSATTGTDTRRVWLIVCSASAGQSAGVRAHGAATSPTAWTSVTATFLAHVDATGHFDLYREAAQNSYLVLGYLHV